MKTKGPILIAVVILIFLGYASAYVVDETEQVVVTQFGKVVGKPKQEPGLTSGFLLSRAPTIFLKIFCNGMVTPVKS